ncbi:tape measure protein [Acinetobacter baumannii]|nr:tape measure protein [Acinetobacter baumannii]
MAQESRLVIVIDAKNAERNARNLGNELDSIERKGDFASKSMDSLSVATRQLAGYMAGLVTVSAAISKMDTYTGLQNRLKLVTNSQVELNQALKDTFNIAQATGQAWDSTAQVYQRFADNAKRLGITLQQTSSLTETVAKAIAISGGSAASAEAALVQFGQALASGVLRGEEFNSIAEQAPGLLKAIATGLDTNIGQLRGMAAEGKLTAEVVVKSLERAKVSVDELFGKTDFTIGNSLTMLNNSITQFIGEAGKGSGAAQALSGSIQVLANNLDLIVDGTFVLGVGLITKAVLTKTIAIRSSIVASAQQRAANLAEAQSQVQLLGVEAMRARQSAALTLTELGLARAEYNAALSANARDAAIQRLTAAEIAHNIAVKEATIATTAYSVAQSRLTTVATLGSRALGLVGGPIGAITIGIMALAAGYMYFQDKAAKANQRLEEQAKVAERTDEALKKLTGNDKTKAVNDLTTAFKAQNEALEKSSFAVGAALIDIENYARGNKEVEKISQDARTGTISYSEAIERLNKIKLPTDLYENLKKQAAQYDENSSKANLSAEKLKLFGVEVTLTGNKAQNAAAQHQQQADALGNTASEAEKATKALQDYQAKQKDSVIDSIYKSGWLDKGYTVAQANAILELQKAKGMSTILSKDEIDSALRNLKIIEEQQDREDKLTEAKRKQTQEIEKQAKLTKRLVGISGQSGIGTGPHLDVRYGGSMSGQKVSNEHLARLHAGGKPLTSYKISSNYGPRKPPTKGASSFHKGIDFSMPEGTPITTNVAVKDIKTWYDSKGGGYVSEVIFEDGVSLKLLHQSPKMQSKVKGGASNGSDKAAGDIQSQLDRQLDAQRSLENEVASEVQRIQNNLKVRLEDVDKAGFLPERTAEIKAELQRRADNDVAIAKQAIRSKLEDYKEFQKTEEQLLEESFNRKKFNAAHDIELSKSEQKQAVELLEQQKQQELGLLKLAQEQRLFQARLSLLSETQAMQERYRLEREEILKNTKLSIEERQKLISLSKANQDKETRDKVNNAVQNWGGIQASITGNSGQFALEQERFSRYDASQKVFDSQLADIETQEQDPNANMVALNAQREQIMKEHFERLKLIESTYQNDSLNLQLSQAQAVTGAFTGMFGAILGESSTAYKTLFATQKAFALAQAGMNVWKAASDAYANAQGTVWNKLAEAAIATAKSSSFITLIQAATPQGFADGGYTGNGLKHTPAGIVHKGEVVWSQDDIKRWGGVSVVESMRTSSPSGYANGGYVSDNTSEAIATRREARQFDAINSNQTQSSSSNIPINVYVTVNSDGSSKTDTQNDSKQLGQMIGNAVRTIIRQEQRQGGLLSK